ncbi:MAG: flagellar protein FlaG [Herminiimonas sp.]|jgi:flagellar protein FlaG|uniref:flagellar protein FlaG n=1 Tax=Herminiimonas sp. TaxID=1926289 RepID=UPI002724DC59|nr:flagellar protein FlaG [Herminiimonas sp.]MDO9421296.1 flagellar protein FlaG [Herminiimonas sp.]
MDIGQISSATKATVRVDQAIPAANTVNSTAKAPAAVMTASAVQQPDATVSESQVGQALQSINKALQKLSSNLEFTVDADSNRTIVKVMDTQTQEIIRQMPSVEAIEISKALDKLQGLLVRQKA